jgi:outer membrane protein assembly complex protein YaeT
MVWLVTSDGPRLASYVLISCLVLAAGCKEGGVVTVRRLSFAGVSAVDEGRLRTALATREGSRFPWGSRSTFDQGRLDADLKRIEAFYADRGYPEARVSRADVRMNRAGDAVDVEVTISEGRPLRVAVVELHGFDVLPPDRALAVTREAPLQAGQPRDLLHVNATRDLAVSVLREHGYPFARVSIDERQDANTAETTVTYVAEPGLLARFGDVDIAGNRSVTDGVIRRQLTYRAGELYRHSLVRGSQRRLYGMELFQFVNIETLAPEASEEAVRTRVTVIEGKHQRFNWGAGYGTEEKARTEGEYRHVNFLGGARSAGVRGRWSSLDRGVRFDLLQPYLFSPRVSLLTDAQQWWTYTPAYRSVLTGGRAIVTRRPSDTTSWSVSVTGETNSSTISDETLRDPRLFDDLIALGLDPTTGRQEGTFTAIGFDYQRSTADSLLDARTGYQLAFQVEHAATWLPGSFSYSAVSSDVRHYLPVGSRLVVANRAQMGAILPANDDQANVPFSKKYFLGGATTIRGWGRFEVSPLLDGVPVGGTSLFAMTSELRAQVTRSAGAVLFFDAGNVWDEARRFRFDELRYSAGVGLRYRTPVGPIRFDVGYQLTTIPDLRVDGQPQARPWRLHFSIGQAF